MNKGIFIVFEGIDGAGKTTQVNLLASRLEALGRKAVLTAEPTTLPSGRELRRVLGGEIEKSDCETALMFTLDRVAHNIDKNCGIEKLLEDGVTVICDRYYYSTLAYQGSTVDYSWVRALNTACPEIRHPDLCIFLDLTPEESMRRITAGRDSSELEIFENTETLTRVRSSFMRVIEDMSGEDDIEIIDASADIESVSEAVFEAVSKYLK